MLKVNLKSTNLVKANIGSMYSTTLEKSHSTTHLHSYIHKHFIDGHWVYDYGQHYNGSQKMEEQNYSTTEDELQKRRVDDIISTKGRIRDRLVRFKSLSDEQKVLKERDVRDRVYDGASNPRVIGKIKSLEKEKSKIELEVHKLHNNLIIRITR